LEMTAAAGSGHPSSSMGIGHLVTVLLFHTMRWSPDYPDYPTSDRLVLSEGHAVPAVYAALAKLGVMYGKDPNARRKLTVDDLKNLRSMNSELDGHPNPMEGMPFFDSATGSLGQGLSVAAGLAEGAKLDGLDKKIYCIIGDGECREGQITEALDYIIDHKLHAVLPIFNCNEYGQSDRVSGQQSAERMAARLTAMGFEVKDIDGHNPNQIKSAFDAFAKTTKPMALIARTVKGWGAESMQGASWHGKPASGDALKKALAELDQKRMELTSSLGQGDAFTIEPPPDMNTPDLAVGDMPSLPEAMKAMDMESLYQSGVIATRRAYGIALRALGKVNKKVVALDADVSNSTFSDMFKKDSASSARFFECKIAEQNMVGVATGLSAAGKVPFCSTFAKFFNRAYDQIEMAIYSGANLKLVGSHAGITLGSDGPSQMSMPDIAWFRAFATMKDHRGNPGCYILQPSDAFAAYALVGVMAEYEGCCYMRTLRADTEFLYSENDVFNLGGFQTLAEGKDLVIAASGYMVHEANKALDLLDKAGISATLLDMYSLPFDSDGVLDLINQAGGNVLTLEDNFGGGLGSAIADALTESGDAFKHKQMFVKRIPKSAKTPDEMLKMCGLTATDVVKETKKLLGVD
ncbi:MAG: transketolase, partial [Phycisphaerae bacterium]